MKMCDIEKDLIEKLKSSNTSEVYEALVKIRKSYVRNQHKMKKLRKYSVIELIIPFLEHPKFCNISLSIIADGCLELSFVNEVIKCNGLEPLVRIMKSFVNDGVQNRACRALGNMAKFEIGFKAVHLVNPVSNIIHFLSETSDTNCQQTAVRTLMILGKNSKTRELIARENGIIYIAKLLHSSNVQLLICSIKAIANLTQNCNLLCARQLLELQYFKVLVELHSHSDRSIRNHALISLRNLSSQEEVRSDLVKVGAVKLFIEILSTCESREMSRLAALALCSCLDHIHMWSHNGTDRAVGLKALLVVLKDRKYHDIHMRVIASLIPLAYESKVSDILLSLNILRVLTDILELYTDRHKCTGVIKDPEFSFDLLSPESKRYAETEVVEFIPKLHMNISASTHPKHAKKTGTKASVSKNVKHYDYGKAPNSSSKAVTKRERSLNGSSSITSDYASSCSPTQKFSTSPDGNNDCSSPSSGVWSPFSLEGENLHYTICWSPVVSTPPDSTPGSDVFCKQDSEDATEMFISSTGSTFSSTCSKIDYFEEITETSIDYDFNVPCTSNSDNQEKQSPKSKKRSCGEMSAFDSGTKTAKKKRKIVSMKRENTVSRFQDLFKKKTFGTDPTDILDSKKFTSPKQLKESADMQTIDRYILLFIWQLSIHLEKKPDSQIADKFCYSALIDYLCYIHNPSPKVKTVLFNLIKNRYCFEKLIINGFLCELEEKMALNYSCTHHSSVKLIYRDLISVGRQEAVSDYVIGTLSHIIATSGRLGQLHAICAISKLITDRAVLYRLLFQANSLSLLLGFFRETNVNARRKAIVCLCELYQSLTKCYIKEKCCFSGTCRMKTSSKCCYKESFLDVTFSVGNGVKILANREKICENSDYFKALLDGYFLETKAELVSLSDISAENLSTIFHFLHGCGSDICCPYIDRIPFSVLLELLSDCDRFLLMNIKAFIEDRLCHNLFPSTMSRIYRQSKINNSPALMKRTLDFALNIDTFQKNLMCNCFEELIILEPNLNFFSDIESLIKSLF